MPRSLSLGIWVIVKGLIPEELRADLVRDFSEVEISIIFANVHRTLAPPRNERPAALFVFGPPAVGKSSIAHVRAAEIFGRVENAVLVDGAEFRDVHGGYQAVAIHGKTHKLLHADAWPLFKGSKVPARLKQRLFREAVADRQHLLIPDCANDVPKVDEMLEALLEAGYELHAMCMWAPLSITRSRGEPRSLREGKPWSAKQYAPSVKGTLALAERFAAALRDAPTGLHRSLSCWDNTVFPSSPVDVAELRRLSLMPHREADERAIELNARQQAAVTPDDAMAAVRAVDAATQGEAASRRGRAEGFAAGLVAGCLGGGGAAVGAMHPPIAVTACTIM